MAIVKDITITVKDNQSQISKNVYLYLGDGAVTLLIEVIENSTVFGTFTSSTENIVTANNSEYARVCILKPNNEIVYSDKCEILSGKIKFEISKEFIDELAEEGKHSLQIHLYDSDEDDANRLTIPPVMLNILKPICDIGHDSTP